MLGSYTLVASLSTSGDSRPTELRTAYEATTRSCCAVTSATRALTSACWALSTSSVVRCPALASSRTPLSATSDAVTCDCADDTCALPASNCPHAVSVLARVWSRVCSRTTQCCASVSLDWRISEYSAPPWYTGTESCAIAEAPKDLKTCRVCS